MRYYKQFADMAYSNSYTKMSQFSFMEKVRVLKHLPSTKMYRDMNENECTYFEHDNNTRFTISSRRLKFPGYWVNHFRSVPYVYKWSHDEEAILPEHYKKACREFMTTEPSPVHWRPDTCRYWEDELSGEKLPVINAPVPVVYPKECNDGLWGGEGIVFGYFENEDKKARKKEGPRPKVLVPELTKRVLYSEILDRWMAIPTTARARYLIDEAFGLDNYILQTSESELSSGLGMRLKRELLVALATGNIWPNNPHRRGKLMKRYQDYIMPVEEAEYVGLPVTLAVAKAKAKLASSPPTPLKHSLAQDLVDKLAAKAKA